jgi:hypothetical protein
MMRMMAAIPVELVKRSRVCAMGLKIARCKDDQYISGEVGREVVE